MMDTQLTELKQLTDIHEACLKFGALLGLNTPVSEEVLCAALEDEEYSRNLLLSRRSPELMHYILRHPTPVTGKESNIPQVRRGNLQLIGKAARALADWGKTGFSTVDEEVYERRMAACQRCDQLEEAPDKFVYKISLKKDEDKRTCKSCGCVVSRKARLVNDTCPLADDKHPGFNRWAEAL